MNFKYQKLIVDGPYGLTANHVKEGNKPEKLQEIKNVIIGVCVERNAQTLN